MELSRTIALMAVVLGLVLAAGYAVGEANGQALQQTAQRKVDEREAQRRAAIDEHQKRKEHFERRCDRQLKSDTDFEACRAAYRALIAPAK